MGYCLVAQLLEVQDRELPAGMQAMVSLTD